MQFYSTQNRKALVGLREAVMRGLAPDNGLYMPCKINRLPASFWKHWKTYSPVAVAYEIASHCVGSEVPENALKKIVEHTVCFDVPLVPLEKSVWALELFHGPTLAFKDFGARFMAGLLGFFARTEDQEITILVATSGDTGSAVAHGFHRVEGTRVIVLYPSGKVSDLQEKQFTTLGGNVTALEVKGTFDDCQRMVKMAFQDKDLNARLRITSANSINMARLIPQSFYYFFAVAQLDGNGPVAFSVPSGNFGNLTGGVLAMKMGLPVKCFIAATNSNDIVPAYLQSGKFLPRPSVPTISNAMDVGNPSNFERLLDLFDHDFGEMTRTIKGYAFTDEETRRTIRSVYTSKKYVMDPHGAVAYLGLKKHQEMEPNGEGIFLETAHPGKFREVVEEVITQELEIPERLKQFLFRKKNSKIIDNRFEGLKEFLMK